MIEREPLVASLIFLIALITSAQVRAADVSLMTDHVVTPAIVGEVFQLDVIVRNSGNASVEIPQLASGLATGRVSIEVLDSDGKPLPRVPVIPAEARPTEVDSLGSGKQQRWSGLTTGFMNVRSARPGRHSIRVRVGTSGGVVEATASIDVVVPEDANTRLVLAIPLAGRPGAPEASIARLDRIELSGKEWIFYRRIERAGPPLVVRLGQVASPAKDKGNQIVAVGDEKSIEAAFARHGGGLAIIHLDPLDGTPIAARTTDREP